MKIFRCIPILFFIMAFASQSLAQDEKNLTREEHKVLYQSQEALKKGNVKESLNLLQEHIKKHPGSSGSLTYYALGNAFYISGNPAEAYKAYEKGASLDPGSFNLCINLAKTAFEMNKYKKAGEFFEKAYKLSKPAQPELLYQSGVVWYQAGEYAKAKEVLNRVLKTGKNIKNDWLKLYIHVCLDLKAWKEAGERLQEFLSKNPENEEYWRLLSQICLNQNDYHGAASALEIVCGIKSPSIKELEELANIYFILNLPLKAVRTLEKAYGGNPGPENCDKLAAASASAQRFDYAIGYLDMAIQQKPSSERFFEKGKIFYQQGIWDKAIHNFQEAVKINPEHEAAHLFTGYCALEKEDFCLARKSFLKASKGKKYKKEALNALEFMGDE